MYVCTLEVYMYACIYVCTHVHMYSLTDVLLSTILGCGIEKVPRIFLHMHPAARDAKIFARNIRCHVWPPMHTYSIQEVLQ
jgi:hypothetical protein